MAFRAVGTVDFKNIYPFFYRDGFSPGFENDLSIGDSSDEVVIAPDYCFERVIITTPRDNARPTAQYDMVIPTREMRFHWLIAISKFEKQILATVNFTIYTKLNK